MQRIFDFIYVAIFGKYTLDGFVSRKAKSIKYNYIFDSVFPNDEIMEKALSTHSDISTPSSSIISE